jgi:hypothetical protein
VSTDAQGVLLAFGAAGIGGTFTGITNMPRVPPNWLQGYKITKQDVSVYVLQSGTAGAVQFVLMG